MSADSAAFNHIMDFRWREGDPDIADTEARLHDLRALQSAVAEAVEIAVVDARAEGLGWARIGNVLGISPRAAISRYSRRSDHQ